VLAWFVEDSLDRHSQAHQSPHPKSHLDRFSHFCIAHDKESLILYNGSSLSPWKLPFYMRGSGPPPQPRLIHGSLGPPESSTQSASQSVQQFLQCSRNVCRLFKWLCFPRAIKQIFVIVGEICPLKAGNSAVFRASASNSWTVQPTETVFYWQEFNEFRNWLLCIDDDEYSVYEKTDAEHSRYYANYVSLCERATFETST